MLPICHVNVVWAAFWQLAARAQIDEWHGERCVGGLTAVRSPVDVRFHC